MIKRKKIILFWTVSVLLLILSLAAGMGLGSVGLSAQRIFDAFNGTDKNAAIILMQLRFPRILGAGLAGAGLAVAGYLLQTVTDNDLCAPNIIGVNSGAGFAVMLMLCLCPMLWRFQPIGAFFGALISTMVVLSISYFGKRQEHKSTIILAGVAISAIFSAGISFLSFKYPDALSSYMAFSVGGFSGVTLEQLVVPSIMIGISFVVTMLIAPKISLLSLGDETASTLGINVSAMRIITVILASAICAAVVSFAGLLGFVGLIVPHIIRRIAGSSLRISLPLAAVCGAVLTIVSDLVGRTAFSPGELPAGLIMAFIGAPFFIYLLLRRRTAHD